MTVRQLKATEENKNEIAVHAKQTTPMSSPNSSCGSPMSYIATSRSGSRRVLLV